VRSHNPILYRCFAALLAFAFYLSGFSQHYIIKNYTTNDGLPSNLIHKCVQDNNGFLWIATANGLSRFDGQQFVNYGPRDGILGNEVISVSLLDDGIIGFYINGCFIKNKNGFVDLKNHPLNNIDASHHVYSEVIDSFLIVSHSSAIYYFNKNTLKLLRSEKGFKLMAQKMSDGTVKSIRPATVFKSLIDNFESDFILRWKPTINKTDDVLFYSSTEGKIFIYNRKTFQAYMLFDAKRNIANCYLSTDSTLYICEQNGLIKVDLNTKKEQVIISGIAVNSATEDREGTIWVSTLTDGLFSVRENKTLQLKKEFTLDFPLANTFVKADVGNFIFGSKNNSFTELKGASIKTTPFIPSRNSNRVRSIFTFQNKHYLFSDMFVSDEHGVFFDSMYCNKYVAHYSSDTIVVSNCFETILFAFNAHKKLGSLHNGRSFCSLVTKSKGIYMGTMTGLYFKENLQSQSLSIALEKDKLVKAIAIQEDSKGRIWIGTDGWGIFVLQPNHNILTKINKENSLESDNILTLKIDTTDKIWVGTDKGILLIQENGENLFNVTKPFSDVQLQNKEINTIVVDKDSVYFTTAKEFVACTYIKNKSPKTIVVDISKIIVNDSIYTTAAASFAPNQNNFKIHLECPLINNEEKAIYYYALLSYTEKDTVWNTTTNSTIEFSALNPGQYTLLVKAQDAAITINKSNIVSWHFTIKQYFYKTWTFGILLVSSIFVLILLVVQYNNTQKQNRLRKELEAESKINELKLQSLLSQMNPHFLFNSLNVIQKFITSNDDVNALNQLSDFSDLMRESLNHSRRGSINLEEEILFLEQYVKLEKKRFDNAFDFFIHNEIDEDLSDISIPPMLIQPLIENAIKHGVSNMKSTKGEIHATFKLLHHTLLEIVVTDNGKERSTLRSSKKKRESHALNIIKERVALIKNEKGAGAFDLTINEVGAVARLKIPIV
jgi:sensor histidine kinase YesM